MSKLKYQTFDAIRYEWPCVRHPLGEASGLNAISHQLNDGHQHDVHAIYPDNGSHVFCKVYISAKKKKHYRVTL